MARKKSVSSNFSVAAGPSPADSPHTISNTHEIYGSTSFDYDLSQSREDVSVLGIAAPVARVALEPPTITMNLTYNQSNLDNEKSLGFVVDNSSGAFAKILNGQQNERNIFLARAAEGFDAVGLGGSSLEVLGFGNSTITSYAFEAAVGSFPTTTIGFQALEVVAYSDGSSEALPAIDPTTGLRATGLFTLPTFSGNPFGRDAVLLPFDINVDFSNASGFAYVLSGSCVQSVSINIDFNRTPTQCLGQRYFTSNDIQFPVPVNFSVDTFAQDLKTGSLSNFLCSNTGNKAVVTIRRPNCLAPNSGAVAWRAELRNIQWDSESFSTTSDGSPNITTLNFVGNVGGSNDQINGLFLSGLSNT